MITSGIYLIDTSGFFLDFDICIAVILSNVAAVSFLVDVELGWKLSFLAGASVLLGAISIVVMLIGAFTKMSLKTLFLWVLLATVSFASVITLVMKSIGNQ